MMQNAPRALFDDRVGDWIQVYTGNRFWPLDPRPEEVNIEDIAHALSMKCRFGGHCLRFYSVAEHSVIVSYFVPAQHALWALLHDSDEACLADIPRPVKPDLIGWKPIQKRVMGAVCVRFGLPLDEPPEVKAADGALLSDEKMALMAEGPAWTGMLPPLGATILGLSPTDAKALFLERFHELTV